MQALCKKKCCSIPVTALKKVRFVRLRAPLSLYTQYTSSEWEQCELAKVRKKSLTFQLIEHLIEHFQWIPSLVCKGSANMHNVM